VGYTRHLQRAEAVWAEQHVLIQAAPRVVRVAPMEWRDP
jgi:hypothetical protein